MKLLRFMGALLKNLREFPEDARHDAGYQLERVQRGEAPEDFKPMPAIAVWVLHAFQKKTQATARRDIELAKSRYAELMRGAK